MKKILKIAIVIFLIAGLVIVALKIFPVPSLQLSAPSSKVHESKLFICPMHPTYTSNKQGDCPICGMKLVEKKDREKHSALELNIDPQKEQYIGIKTTKAIIQDAKKEINVLGTIVPDERRLSHIHTKFSGYIQKVFADYEGKLISKGQPLFTVYSPELVSTQEEFLLALDAEDKLKGNKFSEIDQSQNALLSAAKKRLELWDVSENQIKKLKETRRTSKELTIYSPVNGFITERNAFEGEQISQEDTLYDIADLSVVWAIVEAYETDLPHIMLDQSAVINFPYENIKPITGKVTYIYPTVEETTRTIKIRIELNNPSFKLKPDMYVNAVIETSIGKQIIIPARAVIESGKRKIVFVKSTEGKFIPKEINPGPEINNDRVIYSGINEGDEIVTDGNFLLDSESNLETAIEQMKEHSGH